jgi:hypothetical protein
VKYVLLILMLCSTALAEENFGNNFLMYSNDEALDVTTKAILKQEDVKLLLKNSESWIWRRVDNMGMNRDFVRTGFILAAPLVSRKISTKGFHSYIPLSKDIVVRPDIDYYLDSSIFSYSLALKWRF